jgi:parvulin-like peptidyl-prolyl isomerase
MKAMVSLLIGITLTLSSLAAASATKKEIPAPAEKKEVKPVEVAKPAEIKEVKPTEVKEVKAPETAMPVEPVAIEQPKVAEPVKEEAPVDPEKVVVTVNSTPIREKQIAVECEKRIASQVEKMAAMGWPSDESAKKMMREQYRDGVADMLIERTLVTEQLKAAKITVTPADADARFLEILKTAGKTLEEAQQDIAKQGMNIADIKNEIFWQVCIEKLYASKPENKLVTETEAKVFYDENPQFFEQPEQIRASHILIKTEGMDDAKKAEAKKKIEDILKKARGGEDFAALAKTYTEDPGSKDTGGEYTFPKGKMVPEFEAAALALEIGKISDVVETQFGYHIIKLSEKIPAKKFTFDEMKARIIAELNRQSVGKFWAQYGAELKKNAKIEWSPEEKARRDQKEKEEQERMAIPPQPQMPAEPK